MCIFPSSQPTATYIEFVEAAIAVTGMDICNNYIDSIFVNKLFPNNVLGITYSTAESQDDIMIW